MRKDAIAATHHLEKVTKKYVIDLLNALVFSHTVLWDGEDQFNELPIFHSETLAGDRIEKRGALFVQKKTALRLMVTARESVSFQVCYRICSLKSPVRLDTGNTFYYPLEGSVIDFSIADNNLGKQDPTSYSFCDNTCPDGKVQLSRLMKFLNFITLSSFLAVEDAAIFEDIITQDITDPPDASSVHYKPVFGGKNVDAYFWG